MLRLERLESQARSLMATFRKNGFLAIDPPIIQPADAFLNSVGEDLRIRTYVFSDPEGQELCLRPDITVPTSLHYLAEHQTDYATARYCYYGPAFRYQSADAGPEKPSEIWQAGIESFGIDDREKAETEIVKVTIEALQAAGLNEFRLRMGDIELFYALLDALEMPKRWRVRLKNSFWRPRSFQTLLAELADPSGKEPREPCGKQVPCLDLNAPKQAKETVGAFLDKKKIPMIGVRTLDEITQRLLEQAADQRESGLSSEVVAIINAYLQISGPPRAALARINDLKDSAGLKLGPALKACSRRINLFAKAGIDLRCSEFAGNFGRQLEYYSGFMFQIEPAATGHTPPPIAGGGRYDKLIETLGGTQHVPAVGCTIYAERLLQAIYGVEDE